MLSKTSSLTALALAAALHLGQPAPAQNTVNNKVLLAENGQSKAVIVLPDSSRDEAAVAVERMNNLAAQQLQEFLKRMSGAEFKLVRMAQMDDVQVKGQSISSAKNPATSYILVGESALTKQLNIAPQLKPGAMHVSAAGNVLALVGTPDGTPYTGGTLYAAHHVLENLGVKYLWPGELGLAVPRLKDIAVPHGTHTFAPIIEQRNMRMVLGSARAMEGAKALGLEGDYHKIVIDAAKLKTNYPTRSIGGWLEWHNQGGTRGISGGHSFGNLYERFGKEKPGWFALQPNGSREQKSSGRARLCKSNSELIAQIAADIIAKADADPKMLSTPLSPNDGGSDTFCMCKVNTLGEPGCATYDPPSGPRIANLFGWNIPYVSLTDRVMTFSNRVAEIVAKKHPKLLLVVDAYSVYSEPPVKTTLHPNLVVRYVPSTMEDWDEWSAKASKIFWRPNILSSPRHTGGLKFNRNFGEDLNYAAHHSTIATDFDSILNSWATEGLNYYVLAKLNWNPDADINEIIDGYCRAGFGPAAPEIRRYFDKVGKLTDARDKQMYERYRAEPPVATVHVRSDALADFFTPQVVSELNALLNAADGKVQGAADGNEEVRRRIDFLRIGLNFTDVQARAYRTLMAFKRGEKVDLAAAHKQLSERRALMRDIFENHPLAVSVAYINYFDRGRWTPLEEAIKKAGLSTTDQNKTGETTIDADEDGNPIVVPKTK